MNCSYRILEQVHIGQSVRVTKDKSTVPFDNKPMTNVEIVHWNKLGFHLRHPSLPKDIWVDFHQLPLNAINLEMGIIKNPITFVQEIRQGGSMVLMRADLLDYYELLHDKKEKESRKEYSLKDLEIGERVISSICKDGNVMVYLGTFSLATYQGYYLNNRSWDPKALKAFYLDSFPERAVFAYEKPNGEYSLQWYPPENKVIKSVFKCEDRGETKIDPKFTDLKNNLLILTTFAFQYPWHMKERSKFSNSSNYSTKAVDGIKNSLSTSQGKVYYNSLCHIQIGKESLAENAFQSLSSVDLGLPKDRVFKSKKECEYSHSW